MLRFQNPPDRIFSAMLEKSIELMIDQIKELKSSRPDKGETGNELEYLMPFACRVFTPDRALKTLEKILICHKRPGLYRLNNYHPIPILQYFLLIRQIQHLHFS